MRMLARRHRDSVVLLGIAVMFGLLAASCGGDSGNGSVSTATATTTKGGGGDGNDVLELQRELNTLGCEAGPLDGTLGPDTEAAIRRFQTAAHLTVDGVVGPDTRATLAHAASTGAPDCRSTPAPGPTPTTAPSGTPPCTDPAITGGVTATLLPGETIIHLNEFHCAITWAVATPTIKTASDPDGVDITVLLRWNGAAWTAVDRGVYCDDNELPKAIEPIACAAN